MAGRVKTWVWVVVGVFVVGILFVIAMAGAGFYFFARNIEATTATTETAAAEFDYTPNIAARRLVSGRSGVVGFIACMAIRGTKHPVAQSETRH